MQLNRNIDVKTLKKLKYSPPKKCKILLLQDELGIYQSDFPERRKQCYGLLPKDTFLLMGLGREDAKQFDILILHGIISKHFPDEANEWRGTSSEAREKLHTEMRKSSAWIVVNTFKNYSSRMMSGSLLFYSYALDI